MKWKLIFTEHNQTNYTMFSWLYRPNMMNFHLFFIIKKKLVETQIKMVVYYKILCLLWIRNCYL